MKKNMRPILAACALAVLATMALADNYSDQMQNSEEMQKEQQACGNDVYTYCGEAIPDQDRIATCLKKHWSDISEECRTTMKNYRRKHHRDKSSRD